MSTLRCAKFNVCNLCDDGRSPRCHDYQPKRKFKAFGWDVQVRLHTGQVVTKHYRGCSAGTARRKAFMTRLAAEVISVEPVDEATWIRAYGIGRM